MQMDGARPLVAIFNSDDQVLARLRQAFEAATFAVATARAAQFASEQEVLAFLAAHAPQVVLYDLAHPYGASAAAFQRLYEAAATQGYPFVVTTTRRAAMDGWLDHIPVAELSGHTTDLDDAIRAVRAVLGGDPMDGVAR